MRSFIKILFISLLFALAGCSEFHRQLLIEDLPEYTPNPNNGYLIGSFVYEARNIKSLDLLEKQIDELHNKGISFDVFVRGVNNRDLYGDIVDTRKKVFKNNRIRVDFDIPGGKGQFFLIPLPAGEYQFYTWGSYFGASTLHSSITEPYNTPFEIKSNEVVYAGEIKIIVLYSKFIVWFPDYAIIDFDSQFERDYPEIKERFKFIEKLPTIRLDQYNESDQYNDYDQLDVI